jgi:hypothetical protein
MNFIAGAIVGFIGNGGRPGHNPSRAQLVSFPSRLKKLGVSTKLRFSPALFGQPSSTRNVRLSILTLFITILPGERGLGRWGGGT